MLRRKAIIVLTITLMVIVMVTAFSYLYISQILRLRIANANETASSLTRQLAYAAGNAVPDFGSTKIDTTDPVAVKRALTEYVQTDVDLNNLLLSVTGDWSFIYDVAIVDVSGKAVLHTNPRLQGKIVDPRPDFEKVVRSTFREQIRLVFSPATVYDVSYPLRNSMELLSARYVSAFKLLFLKSEVRTSMMRRLYFRRVDLRSLLLLAAAFRTSRSVR